MPRWGACNRRDHTMFAHLRATFAAWVVRHVIADEPAALAFVSRLDALSGPTVVVGDLVAPADSFVVVDTRESGYSHEGIYSHYTDALARAAALGAAHEVFTMAEFLREARDSSALESA